MRDQLHDDDPNGGATAASLTRIQVRRAKQPMDLSAATKAGDITARLADLARELDNSPVPEAPLQVRSAPAGATAPPRGHANAWQSTYSQRTQPVATGWGRKPEAPDILTYWMELRKGRKYPSWQSLDPDLIGRQWPNCALVHCNRDVGRLQVKYQFAHAVRKAARSSMPEEEVLERVEFTPMIMEWVLGMGRDVAASGKPTHGTENFPASDGEYTLRVIALPMSDNLRDIDHVLCYIQKLS